MTNDEPLRSLQSTELAIYKAVSKLCKEEGIRYYALGGTLLGAVRHQGFIPWDDDIDLAIPRPDYEKFLPIAREKLPTNLEVVTYDHSTRENPSPNFCQIKKTDTKVVLNVSDVPKETKIWLDIFPLDAMPGNPIVRQIQKYRLLFHRMKVQFSMYEQNAHRYRSNRPLHEKILMKFREATKMGASWDTAEMFRELERALLDFSYEKEPYIVNMMGAYKFKEMFPKSWFSEAVELPFEDTSIMCPVEYDKVLRQLYGDYLVPPKTGTQYDQHRLTVVELGSELA